MKKIIMPALALILAAGCAQTKENDMNTKIEFYRNATMKITMGGVTLLTDPMLGEKESMPGFLTPDKLANPTADLPVGAEEVLRDIDGVLFSHTHIPAEDIPSPPSDHLDPTAASLLDRSLPVYVQPFDEPGMKRLGFSEITAVGDEQKIDDLTIRRFEGKHVDIDALLPMVGESSGYILSAPGEPVVLWTGDTVLTDGLLRAIADSNPDVIITHSGGARLPIDAEGNMATLLLDAEATVKIAEAAPEAKIIAIHMEALDHCPVTREDLRSAAQAAGISEERLIIPEDGETLSL